MTPERFAHIRAALQRRQTTMTVLMDNVHKPHNYAAVLRTCDAVGILDAHAVSSNAVIAQVGGRHPSGAAASAGKWVRVHVHDDIPTACAMLRQRGFRLLAAHASPQAIDFRRVDYTAPVAIVLGSELHGVSSAAAGLADTHIAIPMQGMLESLNVSVAAAVILFEAQRQRDAAGLYDRCHLDAAELAQLTFEWAHPRIAAHCRRRDVPYPALDATGSIVGPFPR